MSRLSTPLLLVLIHGLVHLPVARADALASAQAELGVTADDLVTLQTPGPQELAEAPAEAFQLLPDSPVRSESVRIVGRGIQNKETGDSLALGCVDQDCSQLRLVRFEAATRQAVFTGQLFFVPKSGGVASQKEIKTKIRAINKAYRTFKRNKPEIQRKRILHVTLPAMCVFLFCTIAAAAITKGAIITGTFGLATVGAFGVFSVAMFIVMSRKPLLGTSGVVSKVFADQKGWNWESRPKRVSAQTFNLFQEFTAALGEETP